MPRGVGPWLLSILVSIAAPGVGAEGPGPAERLMAPVAVDASGAARDLSVQTLSGRPVETWRELIDATWGPGASTAQKLREFDAAWEALDAGYGAFVNLKLDMEKIRERYRPEIEAGVSRGRFVAIMNHLARRMKDLHTVLFSRVVNRTPIRPGVPLMIVRGWLQNSHFGASLTPLPNSSLVVLRACPNHPLGLTRGDVVLGYDGVRWRRLYRRLVKQELPIEIGAAFGSTNAAMAHALLISAGQNWHLFDTIDVLRHETGEVEHLSTEALRPGPGRPPRCSIWGNEQLPVPGVPMPDFDNREYVTWGIVEGTRIGYVYVASWSPAAELGIGQKFHDAIEALLDDTEGLILDYRLNTGGYMPVAHSGYSLLFDSKVEAVAFDVRGDPDDHFSMVPHPTFTAARFAIRGDPDTYYDHPIAVLTGPGAFSNGDWESLRSGFHPRARVFGKPTNGAFTPSDNPFLGVEWHFSRGTGSGYLIPGHEYLAHKSAPIDEKVWFTLEDVIAGRDTVAAAAIDWILRESARDPAARAGRGHADRHRESSGKPWPVPRAGGR
ncbi:MAG: S41 family peptidase [Thermoanaerobaculia bacterium]|nr:S41 family peptidase [Thermoanaerobaculia bacterium]